MPDLLCLQAHDLRMTTKQKRTALGRPEADTNLLGFWESGSRAAAGYNMPNPEGRASVTENANNSDLVQYFSFLEKPVDGGPSSDAMIEEFLREEGRVKVMR